MTARAVLVLTLAGAMLVACGISAAPLGESAQTSSTPLASPQSDVRIGLVVSRTGAAAIYNPQQLNGAQLAVDQLAARGGINGRAVQLVVEDDGSARDQGLAAFKKLVDVDKVAAILGPTLSAVAATAHPVAQSAGVPVIAISNTGPGIVGKCDYGSCDWIFRASLAEAVAVPATVRVATQQLGLRKVVVVYGDGKFEIDDLQLFRDALRANNVQTAKELPFAKDTDVPALVAQIKAENPDAIVLSTLAEPAAAILTEVGRQMPGTPVVGGNGLNAVALLAHPNAGLIVVGAAWSAANPEKTNADFVSAYRAKFGVDPDQFAAQAFTGMNVLFDAMRRAGSPTDRAAVKRALEVTTALATPLGAFSFTSDHDVRQPTYVMTVSGKKFVPLT